MKTKAKIEKQHFYKNFNAILKRRKESERKQLSRRSWKKFQHNQMKNR
jgi:hypothetical protein